MNVFVFEGNKQPGNIKSLRSLSRKSRNALVQFRAVRGVDHFSILAPTTQLLAQKILQDDKDTINITITKAELNKLLLE